MLRAQINSGFF